MIDILSYVSGKKKSTASGWVSFNAICCVHNGHSQDKRGRGGIKTSDQGWSYHCFNCGYTASFIVGRNLTYKARRLLSWLGVPDEEIARVNLDSLRHRNILGLLDERQRTANLLADIQFEEKELPPFAEILTEEYPTYWQYARDRCVPTDYPLMVQIHNDGVHWTRHHVVVPFTYNNTIVGYSCRFLDNRTPKYIHDVQPGYVFGTDLQKPDWQYAIVCEGIFDALAISGLAVFHNEISDAQVRLIRNLDKQIIVVPDQDKSGLPLIDRALELGWSVSIPDWGPNCKDINDAVKKFGRLETLLTIMQSRETSKIKIELRKKQLVKRLQR